MLIDVVVGDMKEKMRNTITATETSICLVFQLAKLIIQVRMFTK